MEQQVRFCTTSDGVRIAYATAGQGPPLVLVAGWFTHLEKEWGDPLRVWRSLKPLAASSFIVRYDGRGMGLSDREVKDFSLMSKVSDLEAVIDAVDLERISLFGQSEGVATAIAYAARHPQRVERLILYGAFARRRDLDTEEGRQTIEAAITLIRAGWGQDSPASRQFFTALFMPDADTTAWQAFTELQRVSTSPKNAAAFLTQLVQIDVMDLLPQVKVPTLVIHRRGDTAVPFDSGRELASLIPGARFLPLEGRNHAIQPGEGELETYLEAIGDFLREGQPEAVAPAEPGPSGLVTILFTDMEGSTTLTQRLGDARAQEVLHTHNTIVRDSLKAHDGTEIKHTGDGIMASFGSARRALESAITIQRAFASHNTDNPNAQVRVRVGLNAGEPVAEDDDLFGTAVQLAARACAHAEPGQIVIPDGVRHLVAGKGFLFADLGDSTLKGFEDPVRLYEVRWREGD